MLAHKTLPGTTISVSPICLGAGNLGSSIPQADAFALLDLFVEQGGNFLDTAHVYANWMPDLPRSISEKTLGAWMQARKNREQIVIGTKGAHPDLATMHIARVTPEAITQDLHESLQHLQTDYIDLYWLHRDDPTQPVAAILTTLETHRQAGKVRAYGCSNWSTARMEEAWRYAAAQQIQGFVANQPMWSLAHPNPAAFGMPGLAAMDGAMLDFHRHSGWAVIPYTAQARGVFTKLATVGEAGLKPGERKAYQNATNLQRFAHAQELATQHGVTITQVVLSYLLSQPVPTIPVVGCRTPEQLAATLQAATVHLTQEELTYLL
ncbi:MAG: aldo/keto reductase [Caldilineaceae bacterium]